jgi:Protein of unknown function (DUF2946)
MDDIVKQAMAKWPNVPDCYGWLGLDARGNWYMRDEAAQHQGAFDSGATGAKGSLLRHPKLIEFIHRNYAHDEAGQWYFQNGPQKVYVELQATPWIWRIDAQFGITSHTGIATEAHKVIVDEEGWLYIQTQLGFGLVHTQDVWLVANALELDRFSLENAKRNDLPTQFGYITSPQQRNRAK